MVILILLIVAAVVAGIIMYCITEEAFSFFLSAMGCFFLILCILSGSSLAASSKEPELSLQYADLLDKKATYLAGDLTECEAAVFLNEVSEWNEAVEDDIAKQSNVVNGALYISPYSGLDKIRLHGTAVTNTKCSCGQSDCTIECVIDKEDKEVKEQTCPVEMLEEKEAETSESAWYALEAYPSFKVYVDGVCVDREEIELLEEIVDRYYSVYSVNKMKKTILLETKETE